MKRIAFLLAASLIAVGCTTTKEFDRPTGPSFEPGQSLEIVLTNGQRIEGEVISSDAHRITLSGGQSVLISDIASVRTTTFSPVRTATGAWLLLYGFGIVTLLDAFGVF